MNHFQSDSNSAEQIPTQPSNSLCYFDCRSSDQSPVRSALENVLIISEMIEIQVS